MTDSFEIRRLRSGVGRAKRSGDRSDNNVARFDSVRRSHPLAEWHDLLLERLEDLRARKEQANPGQFVPVFGIELVGDDIDELKKAVRDSYLKLGLQGTSPALPWIVFASEIGKDFDGVEYWDKFRDAIGGETSTRQREALTAMFEWFHTRHGGARPYGLDVEGTWANSRKNICWPVTHSILPTRFQRQLWDAIMQISDRGTGRMEYLLFHPIDFANAIADEHLRTAQNPQRFCDFARDNYLLGEIAIAFVTNDSDEFVGSSKTIDDRAFQRIIRYLTENDKDFKRQADELKGKLSGLFNVVSAVIRRQKRVQAAQSGELIEDIDDVILRELVWNEEARDEGERSLRSEIEPTIELIWDGETWTPMINIPSLLPIVECFPSEREQIDRSTVIAAGVHIQGSLLLGSSQSRPLTSIWPWEQPLLSIQGDARNSSRILNGFLDFRWRHDPAIFRIDRSESRARLVVNRKMRLGERYLLISSKPMGLDGRFAQSVDVSCDNAKAYLVELPSHMTREDAEAVVGQYQIGIQRKIWIGPVGLTDLSSGDGTYHWIQGDPLVIGFQSDIGLDQLTVISGAAGGKSLELTELDSKNQTFFTVDTEHLGTYRYWVEWSSGDESDLETIDVVIRNPIAFQDRHASGRYPTQLITQPSSPNLEQLWDRNLLLELRGVNGINGKLEVEFLDQDSNAVGQTRFEVPVSLPVSPNEWDSLFQSQIKSHPAARESFEDADVVRLTFSFGDWGLHSLEFKRGSSRLRWVAKKIKGDQHIELDGPVDLPNARAFYVSPQQPTELKPRNIDDLLDYGITGEIGLSVVTWGENNFSSLILGPSGGSLKDIQNPRIELPNSNGGLDDLAHVFRCLCYWDAAKDVNANAFASVSRDMVVDALRKRLHLMLLGSEWVNDIEKKFFTATKSSEAHQPLGELANIYRKKYPNPSANLRLRQDLFFWTTVKNAYRSSEGNLALNRFSHSFAQVYQRAFRGQDDGHFDSDKTVDPGAHYLALVSDPASLFRVENFDLQKVIETFSRNGSRVALARLFKLAIDSEHIFQPSRKSESDPVWK
ncbi:hypothetical protein FIM07_03475 [SAR202 cluster bacterium AD-802-F09_MRT_200m]|nr:hypothetical protein [SAR202 cluster bacterium AD-802-F09_MRT_200m]